MSQVDQSKHQAGSQSEELSVWPALLGLAAALIGLGIVTNLGFSLFGLLLVGFGLWGWIREISSD